MIKSEKVCGYQTWEREEGERERKKKREREALTTFR